MNSLCTPSALDVITRNRQTYVATNYIKHIAQQNIEIWSDSIFAVYDHVIINPIAQLTNGILRILLESIKVP